MVPVEGRSEPDGASSETVDNEGLVHVDLDLDAVALAVSAPETDRSAERSSIDTGGVTSDGEVVATETDGLAS